MERWRGKVAVVTGASAGVGLATAKYLVQHGLIVIGLARRIDVMKEEMKSVIGFGKFYAKECDVANEQNVIEVFNWIKKTFGSINILINNAGVIKFKKIEDCPTEDLEAVFKVNVLGLLYCTKQAIKLMKENQSEGHIINVNSVVGHFVPGPMKNASVNVYPASKFAVTALSETLKNELIDSKIRVTSISPGGIDTYMSETIDAHIGVKGGAKLSAEDVANAIIYALGVPPHVEINELTLQAKAL